MKVEYTICDKCKSKNVLKTMNNDLQHGFIRNNFYDCECQDCGHKFTEPAPIRIS